MSFTEHSSDCGAGEQASSLLAEHVSSSEPLNNSS
jgi:hypothetical protein